MIKIARWRIEPCPLLRKPPEAVATLATRDSERLKIEDDHDDQPRPMFLIGTAGWAIPPACRDAFDEGDSVLERYATRLNLVEINSSFYRPHQHKTYVRWAASVPERFRFSVKVPKSITHELRLRRAARPLKAFVEQCSGLGPKLGVLLVQLPPTLAFDGRVANIFFKHLQALAANVQVVCEPRHKSWLEPAAIRLLARYGVGRVGADPSPFVEHMLTTGAACHRYWRLHGSPRMYRSAYSGEFLRGFAQHLSLEVRRKETFVVFDNTAEGHAVGNALALVEMIRHITGRR